MTADSERATITKKNVSHGVMSESKETRKQRSERYDIIVKLDSDTFLVNNSCRRYSVVENRKTCGRA